MIAEITPTINNWADKILKLYLNPKGFFEFTNDFDPSIIEFLNKEKTLANQFLIVLEDETCPKCGSRLNRNGNVEFNLNKTVKIFKKKYECSNPDCKYSFRTNWNKYMKPNSNYTDEIKQYCQNINQIGRLSYQKESERLKHEKNINISRETLYKYHKNNSGEYLDKQEKKQENEAKEKNIQFSNIISYEEQYLIVKGILTYRLTAIDPVTKWVHSNQIVENENFNAETIKNFLKPIKEKTNADTIVTDGSNKYPVIMEELGFKHKLCNFHHMKNFIDTNKRTLNRLKKEEKKLTTKINELEEKLTLLIEKRKKQKGRIKNKDVKSKNKIKKIKKLKHEKSSLKEKRRKTRHEIDQYDKCIHNTSLMLKSKTKKTGIKRYHKIMENLDQLPPKTHNYFKNTGKKLENLLLHTENPEIPTTNNICELNFLVTLNRREKKKYKTNNGIENEIRYQTLRWNKRMVLDNH